MHKRNLQRGWLRTQAAAALLLLLSCSASDASGQGGTQPTPEKPFTATAVADFSTPWAMSFLPGSGLPLTNLALVIEREGRLWLVDVANGKRIAVSGVPKVLVAGQGGLGDVVPHPEFVANRRIYLTFAEAGGNGTSGAAMGYGQLEIKGDTARLTGFQVIWRQRPKVSGDGHFSHRIAFAKDGSLFLSSGDRQKGDPAQDKTADLGKIIHLTAEGAPVTAGRPYYSIGHRNVLGLAFAPDGRLWATEMGPQGGDELNLVEQGKNYGWPAVSNGSQYGGFPIPDHDTKPEFEAPKLWWTPSISPAGMIVYSGGLFPEWRGDVLFGTLSGQALVRADIDGSTAKKADHWPMKARIREVEQGPRGEIYLLEDGGSGSQGRLLRLEPKPR